MKARVKTTGEIVEVDQCSILYDDERRELMYGKELEEVQGAPDYWTRLEHTYAGMAMQGLISNSAFFKDIDRVTNGKPQDLTVSIAEQFATALVEKLKGE